MAGIFLQLNSERWRLGLFPKTTHHLSIHLEVMELSELCRLSIRLSLLLLEGRLSVDLMIGLQGIFGAHKDIVDLGYLVAEQWLVLLDSWRLEAQSFDLAWDGDADGPCKILILVGNSFVSLSILSGDCFMLFLRRRRGKCFEGGGWHVDKVGFVDDLRLNLKLSCDWVLQGVRMLEVCECRLVVRLHLDVMMWLQLERLRFDLIVQLWLALVIYRVMNHCVLVVRLRNYCKNLTL